MKKVLLGLFCFVLSSQAFGSDGVIMKTIQGKLNSIEVRAANGARDANATVAARFSFAMGMYTTENRVALSSFQADGSQTYRFQKFNDDKVWENCTVTVAQISNGQFVPQCQ